MDVETKRLLIIITGCAFLIGVLIGGFIAYKLDVNKTITQNNEIHNNYERK